MSGDSVTIARAFGPRLAKRVHADRIDGYENARHFDLFTRSVGGLGAIEELLHELEVRPDCAVLRGGIADRARTRHVRRLCYPDPESGEDATLVEQPRYWLALDIDGAAGLRELDPADLISCARLAVVKLPAAFHDVCALVQGTASHGLVPGAHLRLWYWLGRPVAGAELKIWLKGRPVDGAVFSPCQLIYTARPIFAGVADPLPQRLAVWFRPIEAVPVPEPAALKPAARPIWPGRSAQGAAYVQSTLQLLACKAMTAPRGARHDTLLLAAHRLAELERAGLVTLDEVEGLLISAARGCGLDEDGRDARREVAGILKWARRGAEADSRCRSIAELTRELARQHRSGAEIEIAILAEAKRLELDPDRAVEIAGSILNGHPYA
jgi:hypothetical protein